MVCVACVDQCCIEIGLWIVSHSGVWPAVLPDVSVRATSGPAARYQTRAPQCVSPLQLPCCWWMPCGSCLPVPAWRWCHARTATLLLPVTYILPQRMRHRSQQQTPLKGHIPALTAWYT